MAETALPEAASTLQPSHSDDEDCLPRSPNVRAYVASFEHHLQQLCRKDEDPVKHHHHQRPHPPSKTAKAVMKARHLRAASEDFSSRSVDADFHHAFVTVTGRSVAELRNVLLNSAKVTADEHGRRHEPKQNGGIDFRSVAEPEGHFVITSVHDENQTGPDQQRETTETSATLIVPGVGMECSPCLSISGRIDSEVEGQLHLSPRGVNESRTLSQNDDGGYFSLPGRRLDRRRRSPSQRRATMDDEALLADALDSACSTSPTSQSNGGPSNFAVTLCMSEDEHRRSPDERSRPRLTISLVSPDQPACTENCSEVDMPPDDTTEGPEGGQVESEDDNPAFVVRPSFSSPETLSEMMFTSFGACDAVLCHTVAVMTSYSTSLDYIFDLFPAEARLVQRCTVDLSRSCRFDDPSTGVQFLTLEAVREAARCYIMHERDVMARIRQAAEAEAGLLAQLDARVVDVIKRRTESLGVLDKYRQYADEQERVTRLLVLLAGRLARHDNALLQLLPSGESQQTTAPSKPRGSLTTNRDELAEKLAEASALKSDIDRRGRAVSDVLELCLSADELADWRQLMTERMRLRLQRQESDDWIRVMDQQLKGLSIDEAESRQQMTSVC